MTLIQNSRRSEQGFTLVELAIVMVIIGILIAGILKGQELIANSKISATVSQVKAIDAAMNTFQDKYNSLPGDMATPSTRLSNCTAAPCNTAGTGGTNGNGRIEDANNVSTTPAAGSEAGVMFVQLSAADLMTGIVANGGRTFGGQFPVARAGGGIWVSFANAPIANTLLNGGNHYASLSGTIGANAVGTGALNAVTVAQIDRKLDDGLPNTGSAQTFGTGCSSGAAAGATYTESTAGATCTMYVRVLN